MGFVEQFKQDVLSLGESPLLFPILLSGYWLVPRQSNRDYRAWLAIVPQLCVKFVLFYLWFYYVGLFSTKHGVLADEKKYNALFFVFLTNWGVQLEKSVRLISLASLFLTAFFYFTMIIVSGIVLGCFQALNGEPVDLEKATPIEQEFAAGTGWVYWFVVYQLSRQLGVVLSRIRQVTIDFLTTIVNRPPLLEAAMNIVVSAIILAFSLAGFYLLKDNNYLATLWLLFWIISYPVALAFTLPGSAKLIASGQLVELYRLGLTQVPIIGNLLNSVLNPSPPTPTPVTNQGQPSTPQAPSNPPQGPAASPATPSVSPAQSQPSTLPASSNPAPGRGASPQTPH
jgi:hypothetical protein